MATLSVKSIAASCLDVDPPLSVREDVFGYIWGSMNRSLSLRDHLERISGTSTNLSVFLVGHEPSFGGWVSQAEAQQIQHAIDVQRELYAQVGLGVRKLYWRYIPVDEATGYFAVDSSEATELTEDFSGPNDGIDVFYVQDVTDAAGWSNSNNGAGGPCDKDEKGERTGAVMQITTPINDGNNDFAGILLAHEVGHYLGLLHAGDITNVMGDDSDGNGIGSIDSTSVNLTSSQGNTMRSHCSVHSAC